MSLLLDFTAQINEDGYINDKLTGPGCMKQRKYILGSVRNEGLRRTDPSVAAGV